MIKNILLIIGASSDIGIDLIKNIDEDCLILAHYNNSDQKLLELSKSLNNEIILLKADLSSIEETLLMLKKIESEFGIPNKIVHLAAARVENIRFKDISWNNFEKDFYITLRSSILILNRFLPELAKEKRGKVVLMLSSYVLGVPPIALTHYTTIKYSMLGLLKSLASEYANKNIQVNAISPSMCETKFLDGINEKLIEINAANNPLKRNASVNDITPIIKMLISRKSDYLNGVNIPITGGSIF